MSWIGNAFMSLVNKYTGAGMTGAERQAYDLNVAETMRQEQRQEDFYNRYQSIGAQVRQMQDAGLNPAVLAGGLSTPSPASVSSSSAASAAPGGDPIQAVLGTISGIRALKAQAQEFRIKAAEEKREQEEHELKLKQMEAGLWKQQFDNAHYEELYQIDKESKTLGLDKLRSEIAGIDASTLKTYTDTDKAEVEADILRFQRFMSAIDAEHHEQIVQAQLAVIQAEERLKAASTAREWKMVSQIVANIKNIDADTLLKEVEKTKVSTETKKLAAEAIVAHRTQDVLVEQAAANLAKTDAEALATAVGTSHYLRTNQFDIERGKGELKRAARNTAEAARAARSGK